MRSALLGTGLCLLAAALILLGPGFAEPPKGEKVALLVGVKEYDHSKLPNLKFTDNDVEELAEVLRQAGYARVVLLTTRSGTTDKQLRPTGANIRRELQALLKGRTKRDTILVAFSGHGVQLTVKDRDESFFCPLDANPTDPETMLALSRLYEDLDNSGAGAKLLLVDACRNDPSAKGAKGLDGDKLPQIRPGMTALFSCSPGEQSFEDKQWKHGAFFFTVLEGLRPKDGKLPADSDGDGVVDFLELSRYVIKHVPERVKQAKGEEVEQHPNPVGNLNRLETLVKLDAGATPPPTAKEKPELLDSTKKGFTSADVLRARRAWAEYLGSKEEEEIDLGGGVKLKLVLIPPGKFLMGSPEGEKDRRDDEVQHEVEITKPYYLGAFAVTQAQYEKVMGNNPSYFTKENGGGPDHPVEKVSWEDAVKFCAELSKLQKASGRKYRLLTEAEWEYACREGGSSKTAFHYGDSLSSKQANFDGNYPFGDAPEDIYRQKTTPAGTFKPNALGLFDMHGNVWQWCADYYGRYDLTKNTDPTGPAKGDDNERRVLRGGSWDDYGRDCRSAVRYWIDPGVRNYNNGFRVALSGLRAP
jgi:formylglycine-generating enzyme required for sulfatase activity